MNKAIEGQVAVVFGGAGVIGSEMSKGLANAGATVAIMDFAVEPAQKVADEIVKNGGKAAVFQCKADDEENLAAALKSRRLLRMPSLWI